MSDFLNQFSNDKYKTTPEPQNDHGDGIKSVDHDIEVDHTFHKRKIIRYLIIAATIIVITIIIIISIRLFNRVTIKDFVGTKLTEAESWAIKNKIELDIKQEFSLEKEEGEIISQGTEVNKKVQKGSILSLVVSKGSNPDEKIEIPDFTKIVYSEIRKWIEDNKLTGTNTVLEYNETVEKNKFIRLEFKDQAVTESTFKRKDRLTIYVSRGPETAEKNITVPDFKGKTKTEADTWASENDMTIIYEQVGSETIPASSIVDQSIEKGTKIAKKETITLSLSLGKGVRVPNFYNMSKEEAGTYQGLVVTVKTRYSEGVPYGECISQDTYIGAMLYEDRDVTVVYSEGRPFLDNLVGKSEKELPVYVYGFTSKGVNLTYEVEYVDSSEEKGNIIWASRGNEYIEMSTHVKIKVSKGNLLPPAPPPDPNGVL